MFRIISAADAKSLARLLDRQPSRDAALERRVAAIIADVRKSGDRAVGAYARRYDDSSGPLEITAEQISEGAQATPAPVRRALRAAARHIRKVARQQVPKGHRIAVAPGVVVEQRVTPLSRVGCYVPGGRYPLPSSLLMTAIPAAVAGVPEIVAVCPRPAPVVLAAAAEAGVTRLFRVGGAHAVAALAYGTASIPRVDKIVGPGNAYVAAAKALVSADCAIDFHAGPTEIVIVADSGNPAWVAADLVAQAEHDVDARAILLTWSKRFAMQVHREVEKQAPADGPARTSLARNGGIVLTRHIAEAIGLANRIAPEHLVCDEERVASEVTTAGAVFVGPWSAQATGDYATGSNHVLPTNGAARFRGGLSAADFVRISAVQRLSRRGLQNIARTAVTLADAEGLQAHAQVHSHTPVMSFEYQRLPDPGEGLRLHLNENTEGCSPRVVEALSRLTRHDAAFYPDYTRVTQAVAAYLRVDPSWVLVVNGLDEGLQAAATACLLRESDGRQREAIIVEPAFDMYTACTDAVGGRVVTVPPGPDLAFPLEETCAAIGRDTRLVYLTSPNNPTGLAIPREAIRRIAACLPPPGLVFLDEAYIEFSRENLLGELSSIPNLVIGRTFAKAQGLAAIRAGAVVAHPDVMRRLRKVVPPYSVNVFAATAIVAALEDASYLAWYRAQVERSRAMIYAFCDRAGILYLRSEANFVLVRVGPRAGELVTKLAARQIFIRDRTNQPGCAGCVRITAGVAAHTERCVAAMEDILCGVR